jgi:hypothetical protein
MMAFKFPQYMWLLLNVLVLMIGSNGEKRKLKVEVGHWCWLFKSLSVSSARKVEAGSNGAA